MRLKYFFIYFFGSLFFTLNLYAYLNGGELSNLVACCFLALACIADFIERRFWK